MISDSPMTVLPTRQISSVAPSLVVRIPRHVAHPVTTPTTSTFLPGDKLLCINARGLRRPYRPGAPIEGRVYCCRETYVDNGASGVLLVGIVCPVSKGGLECGFLASRFILVHRCGGGA